jgi:Co/Zn/Cd efflux system component
MLTGTDTSVALRRTVLLVAMLNLAYFFVEFAVARRIGSVALLADSIDFLEDASINLLIVLALGLSLRWRARVGMLMAVLLLVPGLATLWLAWQKLQAPLPPEVWPMSLAAAGALLVNLSCAALLARFRTGAGSLAKAAFLSSRNDAVANVAIIVAALVTAVVASGWPDLLVGLGIAAMNADAAKSVWQAARREAGQATQA